MNKFFTLLLFFIFILNSISAQSIDLSIQQTIVTPPPYYVGQTIRLKIVIENKPFYMFGYHTASAVEVYNDMSASMTYITASLNGSPYNASNKLLLLGNMDPKEKDSIEITVQLNKVAQVSYCATISSYMQTDADNSNNSSCLDFYVGSVCDLKIIKDVSTGPYYLNDTISYTFKVSNNGSYSASGVTVSDVLPSDLTYKSSIRSKGIYSVGSNRWTIGNLAKDSTATMTVKARIDKADTISNCSDVQAREVDPNTFDNKSCVTIVANTLNGINDPVGDSKQYSVFPNPSNSGLTVMEKSYSVDAHISIINDIGQVVITILHPSLTQFIDVSGLPNGIYQLKLENAGAVSVKKIVVQH